MFKIQFIDSKFHSSEDKKNQIEIDSNNQPKLVPLQTRQPKFVFTFERTSIFNQIEINASSNGIEKKFLLEINLTGSGFKFGIILNEKTKQHELGQQFQQDYSQHKTTAKQQDYAPNNTQVDAQVDALAQIETNEPNYLDDDLLNYAFFSLFPEKQLEDVNIYFRIFKNIFDSYLFNI